MACDWNRGGAVLAKYPTGGLIRGEAPPKLKKTRDIGATPRSQTNFEKTIQNECIDPKK